MTEAAISHDRQVRVVIVGGGTAGWMTAAALVKLLPSRCTVHLVESEAIGIVGVGEATLPHIRSFNERLGIDEADFMAATRATFKLGIEFRNWGAVGESYIHPFGRFGQDVAGVDFHHYWVRLLRETGHAPDFGEFSLPVVASRMSRFSRPSNDPRSLASTFGYAYQFDATLFAPYLRARAERLGAVRTEGRIVEARRDISGALTSLVLESGNIVEGDLFVDCSGFVSLLLGKTLGEPFQDWSKWLPCDRAVAMPCRTEGEITPYTSAIAMDSGWRWRIPLQHRTGNGYVYSSRHIADEDARDALVAAVEGEPLAEPRLLRFLAGRRERSWVQNCVGVGLASGFLEPLESTSIYLIQAAITSLIELFPEREISPVDRDEFNRLIDLEYDRIRDFLILHYHATRRTDSPFWNYVRTMEIPDSLAAKIELFRKRGRIVKYRQGVFLEPSWLAVYIGQGIVPEDHDPRADGPRGLAEALNALRASVRAAAESMPHHSAFLARYCPMSNAA